MGPFTASVTHRRLDQQHSCGLCFHVAIRAAAGSCSPAGEALSRQLSISGKHSSGAESSFLADGLEDFCSTRISCRGIHRVCLLATDATEGPTHQSTGCCTIRPRGVPEFRRVRRAWRVTSWVEVLWPGFAVPAVCLTPLRRAEGKEKGKSVVARRSLEGGSGVSRSKLLFLAAGTTRALRALGSPIQSCGAVNRNRL